MSPQLDIDLLRNFAAIAEAGVMGRAAERVGRRGFGLEIDPAYVDVVVRRWQAYTGRDAILADTGQTFEEVAAARSKTGSAT